MPIGICRLCLTPAVELRDSHFMPAALYKIARDESSSNPHPGVVSKSVALSSPRQVSDYLLCAACEERFEQGGESWVIPRCWHDERTFPLRDVLVSTAPVSPSEPDFLFYEGANIPAIETDQLAYFAASLFWRAAVHDWKIHGQVCPRLSLGPYEEAFRRYLLGDEFPRNAVLIIAVGFGMEEMRNAVVTFPYLTDRQKDHRQYRCTVPGITFQLFLGAQLPNALRSMCSVRSQQRLIYMSDIVDKVNSQKNIAAYARTRDVGVLAKRPETPARAAPSPWSLEEMMKYVPQGTKRPKSEAPNKSHER
jgi:hypothetical protein